MKGQAALEFLMTYGWAILIVIAVVAALYAMGVFRLPTGGLAKCSPCFPSGSDFAYVDHNTTALVLRVGPHNVRVDSVSSNKGDCGNIITIPTEGTPGTQLTITTTNPCFAGDAQITITYTNLDSNIQHALSATLHGA